MKILVAGTPGTGKSTACHALSQKFALPYFDISKYIITNKLYSNYNSEYDTYEFDTKSVRKALKKELKDSYIIETHAPDIFKKYKLDHVFVLRTSTDILYDRLEKRGYTPNKITENIDCEIFNEIGYDCEEIFGKIHYIENNASIEDTIDQIVRIIRK